MTKQEMASYLASLISIVESKEDAGIHRGRTLGKEYNKVYKKFRETIDKEHADEARSGDEQQNGINEAGTDLQSG